MIHIFKNIYLNPAELNYKFTRSSGPGGQNVNKVATAVQLSFNLLNSPSLPEVVQKRLMELSGKNVTKEGILIITANRYRTQHRNRQDATRRLTNLIRRAYQFPKKRIQTKPSRASIKRRLENKHRRGIIKKTRQRVKYPFE